LYLFVLHSVFFHSSGIEYRGQLLGNLGMKISSSSSDDREGAFLFQRVSVLVQRFNAVLLHDSLPTPDCKN